MSDEELRRRLRDIPAPRAGIDADAVVARAKRRRRPKTIALSSAATVASVLIVAPLVVTGLQLLPSSSQQEASQAGGAESAEHPTSDAASEESRPLESAEDAGEGDAGASGDGAATLCGLPLASELGMELAFTAEPADGAARAEIRWIEAGAAPRLEAVEVASLEVAGGVARAVAGEASQALALAASESAALEVPIAVLDAGACGEGSPPGAAPVAIVVRGNGSPTAVVGTPWR